MRYLSTTLLATSLLATVVPGQTCRLVADINPGSSPSAPSSLTCAFGDLLLFGAHDGTNGQELWMSRAGGLPVLLKDIHPTSHSTPGDLVVCGSQVFFTADDGTHGRELWVTDCTPAGTRLVADIRPGLGSGDIRHLVCAGERVVFRADDGTHGSEVWSSDGTSAGTVLLQDIRPGVAGSDPVDLTVFGGRAFFGADDGQHGRELWVSDGTPAGTRLLQDINTGIPSSSPQGFHPHKGLLFFSARDAGTGVELWQTDGSPRGTSLVKDLVPNGDSFPRDLTSCGDKLFFVATTALTGFELFVHGNNGTQLVRDIRPGGAPSSPRGLTCVDGVLFFTAFDGTSGYELWKSDGFIAGTVQVADIRPGASSSDPSELFGVGTRLYFQADDGSGPGLWLSDGSTAGTRRICLPLGFPRSLTLCGCKLLFSAYTPATSHELYAIDAPGASVTPFGSICGAANPTMTSTLPRLGQTVTLSGTGGPAGHMGVVWLDVAPLRPTPLPGGCHALVQPLIPVSVVQPPAFTLPVPIPNDSSLDGVCVALQTWWLAPVTVFPIQGTNGVLLGVGR